MATKKPKCILCHRKATGPRVLSCDKIGCPCKDMFVAKPFSALPALVDKRNIKVVSTKQQVLQLPPPKPEIVLAEGEFIELKYDEPLTGFMDAR